MSQLFNPNQYQGRKLIYTKVPGTTGICSIWEWNEKKSKYIRRAQGLQFLAYKRIRGKQRSKCFNSFNTAKIWRDTDPLLIDEAAPKERLFCDVKKDYFEWCKSKVEITSYETYVSCAKHLTFFDQFTMSEMVPQAIDQWLRSLKQPEYLLLQHKTRVSYRAELALLGYILRYYGDYEDDTYQFPIKARHRTDCIVNLQKFKQSQDRNKQHFIPRHDFERFLLELNCRATVSPSKMVFCSLAEFQLGTGCRIGEACALEYSDVLDWETGKVRISKSVQWSRKKGRETRISPLTKTGESRTIFMSFRALTALRKWQTLQGGVKSGLIFSRDRINPLSYRSVQHHYDHTFTNLGLSWRSTHILRHSYSTDFLEKTGHKVALQGQLGHRRSEQTDHYAKITNTAQWDGVKSYNDLIKDSKVVEIGSQKTGAAV